MMPLSFCRHQPSCRENVGAMTSSGLRWFVRVGGRGGKPSASLGFPLNVRAHPTR